jgi:hypothetical protein
MKVHLLDEAQDFDFGASLPAGHEELIQDLELTTLLQVMSAGDKFLADVSLKVLLGCLRDPEAIRYRQRVLADCLAQPSVIREMYDIASGACGTSGASGERTEGVTRIPPPTFPVPSATSTYTWHASGSCGRSPTSMPGSSAPTACGRCSPRCGAN